MSEFVSVTYKCVGSDLKDLFKLYEAIGVNDKVRPSKDDGYNKCHIDFAPIITSLGFDPKQYELYGEVRSYRLEGLTMVIDSVTGYSEQTDFRKCIEARFPSIKVYYKEDDDQSGLYYTNDSSGDYFPHYYLECYNYAIYFKTLNEASAKVSEMTGSYVAPSVKEINNALDKYCKEHDVCMEGHYSFWEYEVR